jgi:predicted permease
MQLWARLRSLSRNLFRKQQVDSQLEDEVRTYADMIADEKIAAGIPPSEARRTTLADLGGIEQVKQSVRDRRTGATLELLWQDVRYALRQLRHNRAFALTAVLTLGLGIGATTAIFSAVYALLLRPLPYPDVNRLVFVSAHSSKGSIDMLLSQDFVAARSSTHSFEQFAGYENWTENEQGSANQTALRSINLTAAADPERVTYAGVTANLLPLFGIRPQLGRLFTADDDRPGAPPYIILGNRLWNAQFHADPHVVGKSVELNGKLATVIGVLPRNFSFPDLGVEPDVYGTAKLDTDTTLSVQKPSYTLHTIALLRPGVAIQQAQAEMQSFYLAREHSSPQEFDSYFSSLRVVVEPLQRHIAGDSRKPLLILLACVAAVLLIACVNVANLQLARAVSRRFETALRGALGASRNRLVRQFLVESLVLSGFAAALGFSIALILTALVRRTGGLDASGGGSVVSPMLQLSLGKLSTAIHMNAWVLTFALGLALVTTILFGLAPAIIGTRTDLRTALQSAAMRISQGREQRFLRHGLLVLEVALAVVLLASAGLLIRSFVNVMHYESGFDPSSTLTGFTILTGPRYDSGGNAIRGFIDNLLPTLQSLPGVRSASISSSLPLGQIDGTGVTFGSPQTPPPPGHWPVVPITNITRDYFRTVGTAIIQGRAFNVEDAASSLPVAIVSRAFAKRYFAGDALGKRFNYLLGPNRFTPVTVVGIADDVRHNGLEQPISPEVYLPESQAPSEGIFIALRSTADPSLLANAARKAVLAVDPQQPLFDIQTMDQRVSGQVAQRRLLMLLIACFALLAVILSAVGVYGVFAYSVSQRTQEMGIRLALGASRRGLVGLIVAQAARLIALGGVLGIITAFALSKLLASMLVGVKPHDAVSFSLAWILMTLVALVASTIPASQAARTDLVSVLHSE